MGDHDRSHGNRNSNYNNNYQKRPYFQHDRRDKHGNSQNPKPRPGRFVARPTVELPAGLSTLQELTLKLGDFPSFSETEDYIGNITALVPVMVQVGDLKTYSEQYSDFLVKCFKQLPVQIPMLATMVSLLLLDEQDFVTMVINKLQVALIAAIEEDEALTVKMLLRAIACLASASCWEVDDAGGLVSLLGPFLAAAEAALQNNNNFDEQSLVCFFLLASTVIWCADALTTTATGTVLLERIFTALGSFLAAYRSPFAASGRLAIVSKYFIPEDGSTPCVGVVPPATDPRYGGCSDGLWAAVAMAHEALSEMKKQSESSFPFPACMLAPWRRLVTPSSTATIRPRGATDLEERIFTSLQHKSLGARLRRSVVAGIVSFTHGDGLGGSGRIRGGWCHNRFAVFTADVNADTAACAAMPPFVRGLAMNYFEEILTFFEPLAYNDGTKYGSLDLLSSHLIALFGLFPVDGHLEYLLVEVIVQGILQTPGNKAQQTFYCRLLLHLCKKNEALFAPVVALAANTIFQLLPDLDHAVGRAFVDWFSFQLVNSQLAWPAWDYFLTESGLISGSAEVDEEGVMTLTQLVLHGIAQQCSLLVQADRLKLALPSQLHVFFDYDEVPKCSLFPSSGMALVTATDPILRHAVELKKMLEERLDGEEVLDWMENLPQISAEGNEKLLGVMFIQTMSLVGHQAETLTAFVGLLDTYGANVLRELGQSEEQHYVLVKALFEVYSHHAGLASFLFDEFLRRGLLHVSAVATLLSEDHILRALITEPLAYKLFETVVDRALDFARASVLERHRLGGSALVLDETADLTIQDEPVYLPIPTTATITASATAAASTGDQGPQETEAAMEGAETTLRESSNTRTDNAVVITAQQKQEEEDAQVDFDEDQDEDGDGRRVRRRVDEDIMPSTDTAPEPPRVVDPLWVADEALKSALRGSRATYGTVVSTLLRAWQDESIARGGESEALRLIAKSLLSRVWRGFHGLQTHLEHILAQRVVLGDHSLHAEVGRVLVAAGEQSWLENWRQYLQQ